MPRKMTDKREWPPGPWHHEPDSKEWTYCTYPCRVQRGPVGALNGYVTLPEGHPWIGTDSTYDIPCSVHGGLTFADGRTIGFDCAHAGDTTPGVRYTTNPHPNGDAYRDMAYVTEQCEQLVRQAIAAHHTLT